MRKIFLKENPISGSYRDPGDETDHIDEPGGMEEDGNTKSVSKDSEDQEPEEEV